MCFSIISNNFWLTKWKYAHRYVVLGLSARIGTLPAARSDTHGTSSRCNVRGTVPCRGIRASFSLSHAYRRFWTDSVQSADK